MRHKAFRSLLAAAIGLLTALPATAAAPYGGWLTLNGDDSFGGIEVPHDVTLNPTTGFTLEAWVNSQDVTDCPTIAGKAYLEAWWVGLCGGKIRAYLKGAGSSHDAGTVSPGVWTHIAVTWDGATQRHYVNGVALGAFPVAGPLDTSTAPLGIGFDDDYHVSPTGGIDEVRLWNVARTGAQLQAASTGPLTAPEPGLVAVWSLDGNGNDVVRGHHGEVAGLTGFDHPAAPAGAWLTSSELPGYRFKVRITAGGDVRIGTADPDCAAETLCVRGAAARPEVFLRIVGPKPNGYLWPNLIKFNTTQTEVWVEQIASGDERYYFLPSSAGVDVLPGLFDRTGFLP